MRRPHNGELSSFAERSVAVAALQVAAVVELPHSVAEAAAEVHSVDAAAEVHSADVAAAERVVDAADVK
jgi:hypothetical protein